MTQSDVVDLSGTWEFALSPTGPWAPMRVPSSWYLEGLDSTGPVWFRRTITIDPGWAGRRNWVRFGGIDYEALVSLDGRHVGGHIGGVSPFVVQLNAQPGEHELVVEVRVPVDEFETVWPHSKTALRGVMGHHDCRPGGWTERGQEWCSGGIWGTVELIGPRVAHIDSVRVATPLAGADAELDGRVRLQLAGDEPAWATVRIALYEADKAEPTYDSWLETWLEPGENVVRVSGWLTAPTLWWTWDHGDPYLYRAVATVEIDGSVVSTHEHALGVREIGHDAGWVWRLNGRPIFIRGSNYIGSQWLANLTPERTAQDIELTVRANLNLLRVHAHVTVPSFYDACDRAGVLVWQDLPMQWGYADTALTYRVARSMVHELVDSMGHHASLAFWCAHNEAPWNEPWMAVEAGQFIPDQNQRMDHELADLFRELDPSRCALANSGAGDGHTYPGWYWGKWTDVSELPGGAFVTEYGAQAVPVLETLRTFLPEGSTADDWEFHGYQHEENSVHAGVTWDMPVEELIARTQAYQSRTIQFSTETYRRKKRERLQGVVHFMFVDPWPSISWAVLDIDRRPKSGFEALRRAMQPVLPSIEAESDSYGSDDMVVMGVWWINDYAKTFPDSELSWILRDSEGVELGSETRVVQILADNARRVMQAGPFDIPAGDYVLETSIRDRHGVVLGDNAWKFHLRADVATPTETAPTETAPIEAVPTDAGETP